MNPYCSTRYIISLPLCGKIAYKTFEPSSGGIGDVMGWLGGIEQKPGNLLRPPSDVASDVGTLALQTAGSIILPELAAGPLASALGRFAPKAVETGIGPLKTLLSYLKGSAYSAGGDLAGREVAEQVGMADPTSVGQKAVRFATDTGFGTALGYVGDMLSRGGLNRVNSFDAESLVDPQVQAAQRFNKSGGFENEPLQSQVELANKRASDLPSAISAEMGAGAGVSAYEIASAAKFDKHIPLLQEEGVFDLATDPKNLGEIARERIDTINKVRDSAIQQHGSKPIDFSDLGESIGQLNTRIEQLRKTTGTTGIAQGITEEMNNIIRDVQSLSTHGFPAQPKTVSDAVDIIQNLNEQRRLLKEFNNTNIANKTKGDTLSYEGSLEAIQVMQDGLSKAIDNAVGAPIFSNLNTRQSAFYSLEDQADKLSRGIQTGRVTKPGGRMVQNAMQAQAGPSGMLADAATGNKAGALKKFQELFTGPQPSQGMQRALQVEDMGQNAMSNIRDLTSLNANPARLQTSTATGLAHVPELTVAANSGIPLLYEMAQSMAPQNAQAQKPPPQFPRNSQAIQQNPQGFIQAVAQISGGNPELMQDVQAVLSEPNEAKRDMAMMELTKMLPQLFEPTAYKSLWNGRIADPAEAKMYGDELRTRHRGKQVDANYLAQSLSALNADGTVLPPPAPIMPQTDYPVSMPTSSLDKPREYAY